MNKNRVFVFDVSCNGKYMGQLGFPYCPLYPIKEWDVRSFVEKKMPSLIGLDFKVEPILTIEADKYQPNKRYKKL